MYNKYLIQVHPFVYNVYIKGEKNEYLNNWRDIIYLYITVSVECRFLVLSPRSFVE